MKNKMILAAIALSISPAMAFGMAPTKHAQPSTTATTSSSNGTRQSSNQYHDRTPVAHDRGTVSPR